MNSSFVEIEPDAISENAFSLIAEDWFLLTAGTTPDNYNTMTASWGGLGQLWHRRVAFVFVRPQRYTRRFMDNNSLFTMSFFAPDYRNALEYCGSHSGRDVDKAALTGLTSFEPSTGTTAFEEASLIFVCNKIYHHDFQPEQFLESDIEGLYPEKGYHRMYVGAIKKVLRKPV